MNRQLAEAKISFSSARPNASSSVLRDAFCQPGSFRHVAALNLPLFAERLRRRQSPLGGLWLGSPDPFPLLARSLFYLGPISASYQVLLLISTSTVTFHLRSCFESDHLRN